MSFKTKFDKPDRKPFVTTGKSKTQQHFKERVDIKTIVGNYRRTGQLPLSSASPIYGDFSEIGNYQQCLDRVKAVEADFAGLPAEVRKRFRNNPVELISFVQDERNRDEAERLGLIEPKMEPRSVPESTEGTKGGVAKDEAASASKTSSKPKNEGKKEA
jgi:phage internal scaffolding protein